MKNLGVLDNLVKVRRILIRERLAYREIVMVAFAMADDGMSYPEAVSGYAEYMGYAPDRVHTSIARRLKEAGIKCSPGDFMKWVTKEVRDIDS